MLMHEPEQSVHQVQYVHSLQSIETGRGSVGELLCGFSAVKMFFFLKGATPPGEDDGRQGALKRFSAMWPSFGKGRKDKAKDLEPTETRQDPPVADNVSIQPRRVSGQYFFEYLVVVSLKKNKDGSNYEPQITYQFPKRDVMAKFQKEEEEKTLKAISLFCFPEGINWAPLTEYHSFLFC
ncbi:hypothetical protein XENOCAPTIV_024055 [Xenoophorus captivus]|uniref:uDENN domain-containing protein n=1 Tax=Xenoophorus captivus TaxID=1517983 RepID=A0ABV0S0Z4_9TELE